MEINIFEIKRPELDARLVADGIARQLEGGLQCDKGPILLRFFRVGFTLHILDVLLLVKKFE